MPKGDREPDQRGLAGLIESVEGFGDLLMPETARRATIAGEMERGLPNLMRNIRATPPSENVEQFRGRGPSGGRPSGASGRMLRESPMAEPNIPFSAVGELLRILGFGGELATPSPQASPGVPPPGGRPMGPPAEMQRESGGPGALGFPTKDQSVVGGWMDQPVAKLFGPDTSSMTPPVPESINRSDRGEPRTIFDRFQELPPNQMVTQPGSTHYKEPMDFGQELIEGLQRGLGK